MITLKNISKENYKTCAQLKVFKNQEKFVSPNWYSLLEANYEDDRIPFGIYSNRMLVGFVMFSYYDADESYPTASWWVERFMIDCNYQNQKIGKKALLVCCEWFENKYPTEELRITAVPTNEVALTLYEKLHFTRTGETVDGEIVLLKRF